ncbi:MAG: amidophosphoribosyltransferase [Candidatus Aminicenantes bacterium RBG_19FT_COMBO_58_17]|nr:MAG: amidophosphoribosyltransferase [Candidatus Aminicenantes bacterium RBG_19FT_COMBO_58_17]
MGGFFGIASKEDCIGDLFYGTDYHSHLGTKRGGLAVCGPGGFVRVIHSIENDQFRSKFDDDIAGMSGRTGIGVISDTDDQPLLIRSHLGNYAIVTVGVIKNKEELAKRAFETRLHFSEMSGGEISPTELIATLINQEGTFEAGIASALDAIQGSCSLLLLTERGIYAARDKWGRTPVVVARKDGSTAVTLETCAFPNLGFRTEKYLGPGEVVFLTAEGYEQKTPPRDRLQICAFLWVYYGYPASGYEGINVEWARNRCGAFLARRNPIAIDFVAGIPDSGIGHGLGYAAEAGVPFKRPFVKYSPTWARSFMPQSQILRDLVARMKLIPIQELIEGKKFLFCEDSIVRGTQLKDTIQRLYDVGALEVHMRPACPPLVYACKFLNFSISRSEFDLAARRAIRELEGDHPSDLRPYAVNATEQYNAMEEKIRRRLNLTTLKYQRLEDLVEAISLPKERLCTYCWDGSEPAE